MYGQIKIICMNLPNSCKHCGKDIPRKILVDGSVSKYNRMYCGSNCKDYFIKQRCKKENPQRFIEARKRAWVSTKNDPQRLDEKRRQDKISKYNVRQWLSEYKISKGCIDCGYKEHFSALQLDHEGNKSVSISDARSSIRRLKKEIEEGKCVVRCANCHSVMTWKRKMGLI